MRNQEQNILTKDIVLVGGGHTHVLWVMKFAMNPLKNVQVTLISEDYRSFYSGMIPSFIAGVDQKDNLSIDLYQLCVASGVRFICAKVTCINPLSKTVKLEGDRPDVKGDILSINIGSVPRVPKEFSSLANVCAVKPIKSFVSYLDRWVLDHALQSTRKIAIVGGGLAGIELAFSLRCRLAELYRSNEIQKNQVDTICIYDHSKTWGKQFSFALKKTILKELSHKGISLLEHKSITLEEAKALDLVILAQSVSAPAWLDDCLLPRDQNGFISVDSHLQVEGLNGVFAVGDIATMRGLNLPRSGVTAVRQAEPLWWNIKNYIEGKRLRPYRGQKRQLKLVWTDKNRAIAEKWGMAFSGAFPYKLKNSIDRKFIKKFDLFNNKTLFERLGDFCRKKDRDTDASYKEIRCLGCGSKSGDEVLKQMLGLQDQKSCSYEDAAIIWERKVSEKSTQVLVQSIDHMPALLTDSWVFGRILVNHCFNDIYAMGAQPQNGLANVVLPYALNSVAARIGKQLLAGIQYQMNRVLDVSLIGGHTSEGALLAASIVANGIVEKSAMLKKSGLKVGDALILTKPIGTGLIFAASMEGKAKCEWIAEATSGMLQSHVSVLSLMQKHQVHAATDVSGFGLLGHLWEMCSASQLSVDLQINAVPLYEGVAACLEQGVESSLYQENSRYQAYVSGIEGTRIDAGSLLPALSDPQTSGPLLFSIAPENSEAMLADLRQKGFGHAAVIGEVTELGNDAVRLCF